MMKRLLLSALSLLAFSLSIAAQESPPTPPAKRQIVTAAQANGIYRSGESVFRVLALGHNKLKVQFEGTHMTRAGFPNLGYATGEALIDGNIATFKPPETNGCEITLVFLPGKLKVTQGGLDSDCGFGHNVIATGTYRKIKSGKPEFEKIPY
jgi:hypothetical protein